MDTTNLRPGRPRPPRAPIDGLALREAREAAGLSVADVVRALTGRGYGLAQAAVYRWELGQAAPPEGVLREMAEIIGCPVKRLRVKAGG